MSNKRMTTTVKRFIEDAARLLVPWGVPQTAARLYGYLLRPAPSQSASTVSRPTSRSARAAPASPRECWKQERRRHGERGSKRALYTVSDNYDGMLTEQNRLLDALADLQKNGAGTVASGAMRDRLEEMAEFYSR